MHASILNVFCDEDGNHGNPVGVVDTTIEDTLVRQRIATGLGYSETVFILDAERHRIAIHNPQEEITFSGHAAIGVAWFMSQSHGAIQSIHGRDGEIRAWTDKGLTWVQADLANTPPWWHQAIPTVDELMSIDAATIDPRSHVQYWAWDDVSKGTVRSRTFAPAWGIPEDEANGSGCMRLTAALGREITVMHGRGSIIHARQSARSSADVGGLVRLVHERDLAEWTK
jgi:predicted PhzF superfamily epimerase YddE/YHI9